LAWKVYRCPRGHFLLLKEDVEKAVCPSCGEEVELKELKPSGPPEEEWLALRDAMAEYVAKGFKLIVYGAKAEVRETEKGLVVELAT